MIYTSKLPADSAGMLYGHLISVSENVDWGWLGIEQ
jgi:hypothetical protein